MTDSYVVQVSWDEVNTYLNKVVSVVSSKDYSGVYGIPRGGSVLAAWLAHKLYKPLQVIPNSHSIIIDDICNSGDDLNICISCYGLNLKNIFCNFYV